MQLALFDEPQIVEDQGTVPAIFWADFLSKEDADELKRMCLEQLEWRQNSFNRFGGAPIPLPRLEAIVARKPMVYSYSGQVDLQANFWPEFIRSLVERVELKTGYSFDVVIGNHYRSGKDHIGWHADKEPGMGASPAIASISLGTERKFQLRPKPDGPITTFILPHGSLLLMTPGCQQTHIHRLVQQPNLSGDRVNLTLRPWKAS